MSSGLTPMAGEGSGEHQARGGMLSGCIRVVLRFPPHERERVARLWLADRGFPAGRVE